MPLPHNDMPLGLSLGALRGGLQWNSLVE